MNPLNVWLVGCLLRLEVGGGMLVVETIGRIRRERLVQGRSIKEIARDLKVSHNTVRKVLRSGETSFSYERGIQPRPKVGLWKAELDRLLAKNTGTSFARGRSMLVAQWSINDQTSAFLVADTLRWLASGEAGGSEVGQASPAPCARSLASSNERDVSCRPTWRIRSTGRRASDAVAHEGRGSPALTRAGCKGRRPTGRCGQPAPHHPVYR
jgi:hypothetical protein